MGTRLCLSLVIALLLAAAQATKPDRSLQSLARCNACVGMTTEVCRQIVNHLEDAARLNAKKGYLGGEDNDDDDDDVVPEVPPHLRDAEGNPTDVYKGSLPSITDVVSLAMSEACLPHVLREYSFIPSVGGDELAPHCEAFHDEHQESVDEFFRTYHRKGVNCARAVDLLCAFHTEVCKEFDTEASELNGVQTTIFVQPK